MGRLIPIQCLVFFTFVICCCKCQSINSPGASSSWAKLQISPDTLSSMEYGNFLIDIYEHAHNHKAATTAASQKKYFYSPLALLDHKSAVSLYNNVTNQSEMRFRVEMWSDKVQNEVVKHLNEIIGHEIKSNQVRVIPLEKVILTSNVPTENYSLSPEWTNYDKSKILRLSMSCFDQKICDKLANEMRSNPEQFDHLKLRYSLISQASQTKQTTISIDSVTSGSMVSKLLQKFGDKNEIFLTANDEKKMLTESATNIRMETFDDSEVASPDTENQIVNILKDLLVTSRTIIKEQNDKMWDSVFWNDDNYRPDKTTKTLNEIIDKLDWETQKKLSDMFQKAERQSGIIDKLTSSNKDAEKRREEQIRRENQSKDAKENENRRSEATEQEKFDRNLNRDDESKTKKVNVGVNLGFDGFSAGSFSLGGSAKVSANVGVENSNTHNTQQENEKRENEKTNSDKQNRNLENKERIQHNYDANSWTEVERISSTISRKLANDSDSSRRVESLKEDVEKLLQESRNHVQWEGEKFVPKPMQLSRINLGSFRDSQSFQDRKVRIRYTNAELSASIRLMEHAELTVINEWNNLKEQLTETSNNLELATRYLSSTMTELSRTKSAVADLTKMLNDRTSETVDIGQMPTSCFDLQRIGHKLSGFFSVKGSKKMEMIYCDFSPNRNDKQKWVGYTDVKSAPVHFHVQRNSTFNTTRTPIPFDLEVVNEGNAMNLQTGKFTAPRPGIYFFSFTGLARFPASSSKVHLGVSLFLNGDRIGLGYVEEGNTVAYQFSPLNLQSTLNLKMNDQLWVQTDYISTEAYLFDNSNHFTHFTGFMLEEEIVTSL